MFVRLLSSSPMPSRLLGVIRNRPLPNVVVSPSCRCVTSSSTFPKPFTSPPASLFSSSLSRRHPLPSQYFRRFCSSTTNASSNKINEAT